MSVCMYVFMLFMKSICFNNSVAMAVLKRPTIVIITIIPTTINTFIMLKYKISTLIKSIVTKWDFLMRFGHKLHTLARHMGI